MSTIIQDNDFGNRFLENIVDWIEQNFTPGQVFSDDELFEWAKENLAKFAKPNDIFSYDDLVKWAYGEDMDFTK